MNELLSSNITCCSDAIRKGLIWLGNQQKNNGRWKEESLVLEVTTTSQAAAVFLRAGFPITDKKLTKAIAWLLRKDVESKITHKFWRLLPLVEAAEYFKEQIQLDLIYLDTSIKSGLKIDPKLNYSLFFLDCLINYPIRSEFDISEHLIAAQKELENTSSLEILGSLWAYRVLEALGYPPPRRALNMISTSLYNQLQTQSAVSNLGGSVAATSFCIINICRSSIMRSAGQHAQIVDQCVQWLISNQQKQGCWQQERSLYGGNLGPCYITSIALRALIEYVIYKDTKALVTIFHHDWETIRTLKLISKITLFLVLTVLFIAGIVLIRMPVIYAFFSVLAGLASIFGLWLSWNNSAK